MSDRTSVFTPAPPEIEDPVLRMAAGVMTASFRALGEVVCFAEPPQRRAHSERWYAAYKRLSDLQKRHLVETLTAVGELLAAHHAEQETRGEDRS